MLVALLLLAVSEVRSATQEELLEQARTCGVSMEYEPRADEGYAARLSNDGKVLYIRDSRSKEQVACMIDWATKRHMMVFRLRT